MGLKEFASRLFQEKKPEKKQPTNTFEIGTSGTENFSGFYREEYFNTLLDDDAAEVFDKMRRNDTQIGLATSSVINSITGGRWTVEPAKTKEATDQEIEARKEQADFASFILFQDLDKPWIKKMEEVLEVIIYGHAVFERVHKVVKNNKKWGDYIGVKKLGYRSPKTIYKWNYNLDTKDFIGITQQADGDLSRNKLVDIEAKNLMIFNISSVGDNLQGISMIRKCYGSWKRKELFLKLAAIGIEKSAIGTPIGKYPYPEHGTAQYTSFKNNLQALTSHNKNFLVLPQNKEGPSWDVEVMKIDFDADKVKQMLDYEDLAILRAFIAQFLALGSGSTGSFALSSDQSDFFLNGIVFIADMIGEVFDKLIEELIILNFGEQDEYPKLKHSRIRDKAGKEFAEVLKLAREAGIIIPDDKLEKFTREKYDMPEKEEGMERSAIDAKKQEQSDMMFKRDMEKMASKAPVVPPQQENNKKPIAKVAPKPDVKVKDKKVEDKPKNKFDDIHLAEKKTAAQKQIERDAEKIKPVYETELKKIGDDLVSQVVKNYENATTDIQKINASKNIQPRGIAKYRKALFNVLSDISLEATEQALNEFKKGVKLSEITLAKKDTKTKIVNKNKNYITSITDALAETQVLDLKKAVVLQFASTIGSTDDSKIIQQDLSKKINKDVLNKINSAPLISSTVVNKSRLNFFLDDDIVSEIESFTFRNADPVSQICRDLQNKTFLSSDQRSLTYAPPLHHNCKSVLEPNYRGDKKNPEISDGGLDGQVTKAGKKSKTLSDCGCDAEVI